MSNFWPFKPKLIRCSSCQIAYCSGSFFSSVVSTDQCSLFMFIYQLYSKTFLYNEHGIFLIVRNILFYGLYFISSLCMRFSIIFCDSNEFLIADFSQPRGLHPYFMRIESPFRIRTGSSFMEENTVAGYCTAKRR